MGAKPRFDAEQLLMDLKTRIINEYNDVLAELVVDKAKDSNNIVLENFKGLGGGIVGGDAGDEPGEALDVCGLNRDRMQTSDPYMFIQFAGNGINLMQDMGDQEIEVVIMVSLLDPFDSTGEIRMLRYVKAVEMMFAPMSGRLSGVASLTGVQVLPYLSGPDYWDKTKFRLTWGLGLKFHV